MTSKTSNAPAKSLAGDGASRRPVGAAALACVAGAAALCWALCTPAAPDASPLAPPSSSAPAAPISPRTGAIQPLATSAALPSARTPPDFPDPEVQLAVTADQHLVVNAALLLAFNHYLVDLAGRGSKDDLLAFLKTTLPSRAFDDARPLVDQYLDYMQDHDRQLAIQLPAQVVGRALDPASVAAWLAQRDRLRQIHLGVVVTQAWYQNDDSQLRQALDELDARAQLAAGGTALGATPVPHWADPAAEARHVQSLRTLVAQAATSFQALQQARKQDVGTPPPNRSPS